MTIVAIAYRTLHGYTDQLATHVLITGFTEQLKGWWYEHLTTEDKDNILNANKIDVNSEPILQDGDTILDAVATLIFTIAKIFTGDPKIFKKKSLEFLNNLKYKKLSDFKWYKDTFLTRIYARTDGNKVYWKEKFLDTLFK